MRAESLAREHARLARRNLEMVLTERHILSCVPGSSLSGVPMCCADSAAERRHSISL
jgi:hypothetical protein